MPVTKDVIAHILKHVNAESANSAPSHTPGMARRAQFIRDALATLTKDSRSRSTDEILTLIDTKAAISVDSTSFTKAITDEKKLPAVDQSPWSMLQGWMESESERP